MSATTSAELARRLAQPALLSAVQPGRPIPLPGSRGCSVQRACVVGSFLHQYKNRIRRFCATHADYYLCVDRCRYPVGVLLDIRQGGRTPEAIAAPRFGI